MRKNSVLRQIPSVWQDMSIWPRIHPDALPEPERDMFVRRRKGIAALLNGASYAEISSEARISARELRRLLRRCVEPDGSGGIWGELALVPHVHIHVYSRITPVNRTVTIGRGYCAGALTKLLAQYPEIEERLDAALLKRGKVNEPSIFITTLHKLFLEDCIKAGLEDRQAWPFNTKTRGHSAIRDYVSRAFNRHPEKFIRAQHGSDSATRLKVGTGHDRALLAQQPYDIVGLDELTFDAINTIAIQAPGGGEQDIPIQRIHIVLVVELVSKAILSWYAFFRESAKAGDIREAIQRALSPWKPMAFTVPGLIYGLPDAGMPSGLIPSLAYQGWTVLMVDNALAHQDTSLLADLSGTIGCMVNLGPVNAWYRRAELERSIKEILTQSAQRLPSTTGSNPIDPRKDPNPVETAVRLKIRWTDVRQVTEVVIAQYNATPSEGIGMLSPMGLLRQFSEDSDKFFRRPLPTANQRANFLTQIVETVIVRGSKVNGIRPFVRFERGRYTNSHLASAWHLIGKKIHALINEDDIRTVDAVNPETGEVIGILAVGGRWRHTPHTRTMRQEINRLRHLRQIAIPPGADPIPIYLAYLADRARQSAKGSKIKISKAASRMNEIAERTGVSLPQDAPRSMKSPPVFQVDIAPNAPKVSLRDALRNRRTS